MSTALIIGASRGIGRELVRQYRADNWRVIATARRPQDLADLGALGCEAIELDVTSVSDCSAFALKIKDAQLDVAVLNSGIYGTHTAGLESPSAEEFNSVMQTNVLAAMRLLPIIAPNVACVHGRLAVTSSQMGSISMRTNGSGWLYRASKAALNSILVDTAWSAAASGAICIAYHPGWVRTDMGGPGADLAVEDSATAIRAMLAGLTAADNGKFFNHDGSPLSW